MTKVLVVDDDELSRFAVAHMLEEAGYTTLGARDGAEAVDLIEREDIRLVVTDWQMPGMNGLDLCRWVRTSQLLHYVYVILLTVRQDGEAMVEGMNAGADDYIAKPFRPGELLVRLRAGQRVLALETRDVTIFAMAKLAESRDPETGEHLDRVRNYVRLLAQKLADDSPYAEQIDSEFIRLIYLTSPLHDIGKVGIPDSVLLKPGRLSDREFEIMKAHTTIGADTLAAACEHYPDMPFLRMAQQIALSHHERYDGAGYPHGLGGQDIPLAGRIMALADVYDALTSKRIYKAAMTHEIARQIVVEERGRQFDPHVVDAFLAVEERFVEVGRRRDSDGYEAEAA